jgi:hypothetical protein
MAKVTLQLNTIRLTTSPMIWLRFWITRESVGQPWWDYQSAA